MTLQPSQSVVESPILCIVCGSLGGVDFILNVVLFVPIGMTLRWTMGRWWDVVIIGFITTVVIETLQWRVIPGRDAALGDVIANTLGTLIGGWLAVAVFDWVRAGSLEARMYARMSGMAAALVVIASALLLQPLVPRYPLWVQWEPVRMLTDPFQGKLINVEVKGHRIRGAESYRADKVFDPSARSVHVRAELETPGPAPSRRTAIIVRTANPLEEGFFLAQRGDAATFRSHIVAERLKLRPVLVGLPGAFAGTAREKASKSFVVEGESNPRSITVRRLADENLMVSMPRTVGLAWTLLLSKDIAVEPRWLLANAVWLAALIFPASFFVIRAARASRGPAQWFAWSPMALVLAVLIATPLAGLSSLGIVEWGGIVAGIAAAWLLERWSRRLAPQGTPQHIVSSDH